ncbi:MAG: hypothetical protein PSX81_01655 [bacterium]|nr:hypothetical protein [bacterium]
MIRFLVIFFLVSFMHLKGAELRKVEINKQILYYYFSPSNISKKGLLIFLHGAVSQYKNCKENTPVNIETLLENNMDFIASFNNAGFDLILPISYNEFNWLEDQGKQYIDTLIKINNTDQSKIFLTGFSDGGTGAYQIFYNNPQRYDGLIIFNGYPQYSNFQKTVDYQNIVEKKIIFCSQRSDKVIPYEFLLSEYRRQKMLNKETYFLLTDGHHKFNEYSKNNFKYCITLMDTIIKKSNPSVDKIWIYAPLDALQIDSNIISFYPFRKSSVKKYGMNSVEYKRADYDYFIFSKMLKKSVIQFIPVELTKADLFKNDNIEFMYLYEGKTYKIFLKNYLKINAFN